MTHHRWNYGQIGIFRYSFIVDMHVSYKWNTIAKGYTFTIFYIISALLFYYVITIFFILLLFVYLYSAFNHNVVAKALSV